MQYYFGMYGYHIFIITLNTTQIILKTVILPIIYGLTQFNKFKTNTKQIYYNLFSTIFGLMIIVLNNNIFF